MAARWFVKYAGEWHGLIMDPETMAPHYDIEGYKKAKHDNQLRKWILGAAGGLASIIITAALGWLWSSHADAMKNIEQLNVKSAVHETVLSDVKTSMEKFDKKLDRIEAKLDRK